jgi:hypothetical protein
MNSLMKKCLRGLLVLTVAGCAPGQGDISGKVKFKGDPVTRGTVMFYAADRMYQGDIRTDGSYQIERVPVGKVKIALYVPPPSKPLFPDSPNFKFSVPDNAPAAVREGYLRAKGKKGKDRSTEKDIDLPEKYKDAQKSGLEYDVKPGPQTKNLDLTP